MPIFFDWSGGEGGRVNDPEINFLNVNFRESLVARIIYRGPDGGGGGGRGLTDQTSFLPLK